MKTKIVYVLVSSEKDIFLEELLLSLHSLRLFNKDAHVAVIVDDRTDKSLNGKRANLKAYINELIVVQCPNNYNPKECSRYIKTSVRQNIKGDFLFVDTDTIILDNLSDIDNIEYDIACVPDLHTQVIKDDGKRKYILDKINFIFEKKIDNIESYFNSGVMYVKDNKISHNFYHHWHQNWIYSNDIKHNSYDQPSLFMTDYNLGHVIKNLDDNYNCQINSSIKYLFTAKIIHIFNAPYIDESLSIFLNRSVYYIIKKEGFINNEITYLIKNFKCSFPITSYIIGEEKCKFLRSKFGNFSFKIYSSKFYVLLLRIKKYCISALTHIAT